MKKRLVLSKSLPILVTGALLTPLAAQAVPSFARQTGLTCAMCHTVFPQLTPYGRMFKLSGYTGASGMFNEKSEQSARLSEDSSAPLSAMLQISYTNIKKGQQDNGSGAADTTSPGEFTDFPDQFSFFYAGRVSDHVGAFAQITVDNSGSAIAMDNTDVRAANSTTTASGKQLVYGLSLNNAPTVEDILNTTPVWAAFPSATTSHGSYNSPAAPLLLGSDPVSTQVAGLVAYGMYDNTWYGAVGMYHDAIDSAGSGTPGITGWAPYYRFAYQQDNGTSNFDVGVYGMMDKMSATPMDTTSLTSAVTDTGVDAQYQVLNGVNTFTGRFNYLTESVDSPANVGSSFKKINTIAISGTYYYDRKYGGSLGYFANSGSAATGGSDPSSNYWMAEYDYLPWLNTKFSLQYTAYNKINGTSSNAGDANTIYALAWFMF